MDGGFETRSYFTALLHVPRMALDHFLILSAHTLRSGELRSAAEPLKGVVEAYSGDMEVHATPR